MDVSISSQQLGAWVQGKWKEPLRSEFNFSGVCTDSRKPKSGTLFFALSGENFDALQFVVDAIAGGCIGAVVEKDHDFPKLPHGTPIYVVKNVLEALQQLARGWRIQLKTKIVGIAGSNGKTSTKNFSEILCKTQTEKVWKTQGNLNNHIGVPLTLLQISPAHSAAIVEMGMNHPGELKLLTQIADPDICLITNIAHEHMEFFKNLDEVADAESEIFQYSRSNSIRIFNLDDPLIARMRHHLVGESKVAGPLSELTFSSTDNRATVGLKASQMDLDGLTIQGYIDGQEGTAKTKVFGSHQVSNLMAAACAALAVGRTAKEIWAQLPFCNEEWGRGQRLQHSSGARILFDGYNSNLESALAAIQNMGQLTVAGRKIGIFSDMLELGKWSAECHQRIGAAAATVFDVLWYFGKFQPDFEAGLSRESFVGEFFGSQDMDPKVASKIAGDLKASDVILLKGSRGQRLERVLAAWGIKPSGGSGH